jgi:dolichyl-diphosphooligosaccharide--protein glycosyltransferase
MTNYPTGSYVHFGPLFDQIIAITALILGLGHPSTSLIDHIGAYLPAVLGALTVIPVYYIGKYLRGKKTGMIAAILITFAPGQSISRSLLGFTDHHVAEVFFSTLFIMFFMLALITARRKKVTFEDVFNKKYDNLKKPLLYSIVAGVAYSAYQLVWPGAPLFIVIVMVYALVQYILNNLRKESSDYLGIVGIPTFLVSAVLVLPFVNTDFVFQIFYYSWFHVVASLCAMIGFITLSGMEKLFVKNKLNKYYYPLAIFGVAIAGILITYIFMPSFYAIIINSPSTIFGIQTGGASTIAEASSLFYEAGIFTLAKAYGNFTPTGFFASIVAIFILIANTIKKPRSQEVLALVWGVLILFAIYGQNRYAYYYSVNVSILSAFVGGLLLEKVKLGELEGKFKSTVKSVGDLPEFFKFIKIQQIVMVLVIVAVLIMPTYSYGMRYTNGGLDPNEYWMEACLWMKTNTPDPGMDYNKIYDAPKTGESFKYPDTVFCSAVDF